MRPALLVGLAVTLSACAESPIAPAAPARALADAPTFATAATVTSSHLSLAFKASRWIACANEGQGESVALSGAIDLDTHVTDDGNGGVHVSAHVRPDHVTGIGDASGLTYRGTGGTGEHEFTATDGSPSVYSFVNNFRIIGPGKGNNILVHYTIHQTLNANGDLMADVDISSSECR